MAPDYSELLKTDLVHSIVTESASLFNKTRPLSPLTLAVVKREFDALLDLLDALGRRHFTWSRRAMALGNVVEIIEESMS